MHITQSWSQVFETTGSSSRPPYTSFIQLQDAQFLTDRTLCRVGGGLLWWSWETNKREEKQKDTTWVQCNSSTCLMDAVSLIVLEYVPGWGGDILRIIFKTNIRIGKSR